MGSSVEVGYDWRAYYWKMFLMMFIWGMPARINFVLRQRRKALSKKNQYAKVAALLVCTDLAGELRDSAPSSPHHASLESLFEETMEIYQQEENKLLASKAVRH